MYTRYAYKSIQRMGFAQKVGNGHARFEICHRQSSGTQQRCAISSAIALADCTWLLDIGDRRMRIGEFRKQQVTFYASRKEGNTFLFTSVQHEPRLRNLSVRVCCITPIRAMFLEWREQLCSARMFQ